MSRYNILLVVFFYCFSVNATDLTTYYEKSGCLETPRYDETISYCKLLEVNCPYIKYTTFGISPQGRDLPLLILDKKKNFTLDKIKKSGNLVVLIQACIHSGECEGKDAGLILIRDYITNKLDNKALDNITILFIPIFSVDAHERFGPYNRINQNGPKEMGWRTTAQNLNLNRDYMKADAPEMQAWLRLFTKWLPDFFVDCHTTDGADYQYAVTYGLETGGNLDSALTFWQDNNYLPYVKEKMENSGFPIFKYIFFRDWHDPRSGITSWASPPMLSQGYTALLNRPGLLIETHMLKPYKPRVESTYFMLLHTLELLAKEKNNLQNLISRADSYTKSEKFRKTLFPLNFNTSYSDSIMTDFLGIDYDVTKSDLTGGEWIQYNAKPKVYQIPLFNKELPGNFVALPEAYIIPVEWSSILNIMALHGIEYKVLKNPAKIRVNTYKFKNVQFRQTPNEGRHMLNSFDLDLVTEDKEFPAGSFVIDMNQRTAKVIAHLMEPKAYCSFVNWGFMNGIFEQKEYSEHYVMEKMAREMLKNDPALKTEFESKMKNDTTFAKNPNTILNWFYSKTPYWDDHFNSYPIGKIFDRSIVDKLEYK
jgi:hypothetical protein